MYNLTGLYEADTIYKLTGFANSVVDYKLISLLILSIFFVMLLILRDKLEFKHNFLVTSFVCFVISVFLSYAKLLSSYYVIGLFLLSVFSAMFVYMTQD